MMKMILLMSLFSVVAQANQSVKDIDVKNLTDMQISFHRFDLLYLQKYQETIDFCEEILKHKPHNPEAHFGKGRALASIDRWQEAVESYDLAIKYKRHPLGEVYYYKGIALESLDKLEEALKAYDLAIQNNLGDRHTYYAREGVLMKLGRISKGE